MNERRQIFSASVHFLPDLNPAYSLQIQKRLYAAESPPENTRSFLVPALKQEKSDFFRKSNPLKNIQDDLSYVESPKKQKQD
jgi:hypothetical protein